jgi:aminopeptidase N
LNRSLLEPGVSHDLARNRRKAIRSVAYTLALDIPADSRDSISGHIKIRIQVDVAVNGIALDFAPVHSLDDAGNRSAVKRLSLNGQETDCRSVNGHIVLPVEEHFTGPADIEIDFVAGEQALTRRQDLLYSLFVPDRAHTCFPCFDQPDLKARFELALTLPGNWSAVGNGRLMQNQEARGRHRIWPGSSPPPATSSPPSTR